MDQEDRRFTDKEKEVMAQVSHDLHKWLEQTIGTPPDPQAAEVSICEMTRRMYIQYLGEDWVEENVIDLSCSMEGDLATVTTTLKPMNWIDVKFKLDA